MKKLKKLLLSLFLSTPAILTVTACSSLKHHDNSLTGQSSNAEINRIGSIDKLNNDLNSKNTFQQKTIDTNRPKTLAEIELEKSNQEVQQKTNVVNEKTEAKNKIEAEIKEAEKSKEESKAKFDQLIKLSKGKVENIRNLENEIDQVENSTDENQKSDKTLKEKKEELDKLKKELGKLNNDISDAENNVTLSEISAQQKRDALTNIEKELQIAIEELTQAKKAQEEAMKKLKVNS